MRIRAAVLDADPLCARCRAEGRTVAAREVDHVLPLHRGGTDDRANLQGLCAEHHEAKTAGESALRRGRLGHTVDGVPLSGLRGGAGSKWDGPRLGNRSPAFSAYLRRFGT